jgi:hypothetical protein
MTLHLRSVRGTIRSKRGTEEHQILAHGVCTAAMNLTCAGECFGRHDRQFGSNISKYPGDGLLPLMTALGLTNPVWCASPRAPRPAPSRHRHCMGNCTPHRSSSYLRHRLSERCVGRNTTTICAVMGCFMRAGALLITQPTVQETLPILSQWNSCCWPLYRRVDS